MRRLFPSARVGLHLGVIVLVVSSAIVGGRWLAPSSGAQEAGAIPTSEFSYVSSAPTAKPASGLSAATVRDEREPAYGPPTSLSPVPLAEASGDEVRAALGLPGQMERVEPEEDILALRRMASSRGGSRSPEAASPSTPDPAPAPEPKKELKVQTYRVVPGDTLMGIADKFGITPETALWANDLGNGELLQIDQELKILPVSGVLHTVRKGETLGGIADAYMTERDKIIDANYIANPDSLQEGQTLIIPGGMRRTTEPIRGLPEAPSAQQLAAAPKYTVKAGDTLMSIAEAFGVRVSTIQVANGLLDPDNLRLGLVLSIPGAKQGTAAAPKPQVAPAPPPKPQVAPAPAPKPQPAPAPDPAPAPASPAGSRGDQLAAIAQQYLGYPYVWGGHSPGGFDCSGFTWYVYKQAGINVPLHDLWGQLGAGPRIGRGDLQPGDIVFFENTYKPGLSHSGIYLGGGRFINAETEEVGVQIRSLSDPYWSPKFVGGSRPR